MSAHLNSEKGPEFCMLTMNFIAIIHAGGRGFDSPILQEWAIGVPGTYLASKPLPQV